MLIKYSDVVREAQELVELALKAMLRAIGVDPPKWHDVGPVLLEHAGAFDPGIRNRLPRLAAISRWLRKEREFAFCGDIDFIPTEQYSAADAERAIADANEVYDCARAAIEDGWRKMGEGERADRSAVLMPKPDAAYTFSAPVSRPEAGNAPRQA